MSSSTSVANPVLAPVQQAERIQIVDILSGFTLFGILLVNMGLLKLQPMKRS